MPDLTTKTGDVKAIIRRLQDSFNETLEVLYDLPQDYLQQPCGHGCARGGTARDLLIHNIFHEKQHTGQVWSVRDQLQLLPGWGNQDLPALLAGLPGALPSAPLAPPPARPWRAGGPHSLSSLGSVIGRLVTPDGEPLTDVEVAAHGSGKKEDTGRVGFLPAVMEHKILCGLSSRPYT